ncbi:MAG: ArnT family glycosyltransferase [Dissulfurispiraceae bacterium]
MKKKSPKKAATPEDRPTAQSAFLKYWPHIIAAIIIVFVVAIRIRLLETPLERDEGEFAYMGQLLLQGIPPYLIVYSMKLPGIYAAYALMMAVFGQTIVGVHLGLLAVNSIAIILMFILARRLFDDGVAAVAASSYALLSLSPTVLGTSAHATQFIVPFVLGGTIVLLKALDSGKYLMIFVSGLAYGMAFIMKQHAVFFIPFAALYFSWCIIRTRPLDFKRLASGTSLLLMASAIPFLITCASLYFAGTLSKFWFWTFTYAHQYVSLVSLSEAVQNLKISVSNVVESWDLLWIIAGIGLTSTFWYEKARSNRFFLIVFTLFSFFTICPGFFFREHYFVTILPSVALLAGVATSAAMQFLSVRKMPLVVRLLPIIVTTAALVYPITQFSDFFFRVTPVQACRMMYGATPFPESIEIATYIRNHSTKEDKIAVIGSEPQIYFYADRKSATGYIYVYGLMEPQYYASWMQHDMIREIEADPPKYVVFIKEPTSWLASPTSDMTILNWTQIFTNDNFRIVGIIDMMDDDTSISYWDEEISRYKPQSTSNLVVFERKEKIN